MEIAVGMHQHQGKREYQQDTMSIKQFGSLGVLAILADGMGGYEGGEIASRLVSENFREFTIEGEDIASSLKKYLLKGNDAINAYKEEHPEVKNMGTTAIAFFMSPKSCQWISVGDSPLYVIRNRKVINRINENHSIAGLLDLQVRKGEITREEALSNRQRHMLTSAISGDKIPQMDISVPYSIKNDDIFILASDGIETISEERIKEIVLKNMPIVTQQNAQKACEALVDEVISRENPTQDNVTVVILANIEDDEPETILYKPAFLDDRKKLLAILGVVLAMLFLIYFLLMYDGDSFKSEKSSSVGNAPAIQKRVDGAVNGASSQKRIDNEASLTDEEKILKSSDTPHEDEKMSVMQKRDEKAEKENVKREESEKIVIEDAPPMEEKEMEIDSKSRNGKE